MGVGGKDDIKINGAGQKAPEDRDFRETGCQTETLHSTAHRPICAEDQWVVKLGRNSGF